MNLWYLIKSSFGCNNMSPLCRVSAAAGQNTPFFPCKYKRQIRSNMSRRVRRPFNNRRIYNLAMFFKSAHNEVGVLWVWAALLNQSEAARSISFACRTVSCHWSSKLCIWYFVPQRSRSFPSRFSPRQWTRYCHCLNKESYYGFKLSGSNYATLNNGIFSANIPPVELCVAIICKRLDPTTLPPSSSLAGNQFFFFWLDLTECPSS